MKNKYDLIKAVLVCLFVFCFIFAWSWLLATSRGMT